jgi:hypothetical protein
MLALILMMMTTLERIERLMDLTDSRNSPEVHQELLELHFEVSKLLRDKGSQVRLKNASPRPLSDPQSPVYYPPNVKR